MKRRLILFLAILSFGSGALPGQQDEFDPLDRKKDLYHPSVIRFTVDIIDVPSAFLGEATAKGRASLEKDHALWQSARELVAKGEGRQLEEMTAVTKPGLPMRMGTFTEFIYPTEYDPPELQSPVKKPDGEEGTPSDKPSEPPAEPVAASESGKRTPFSAAAFETRNVGSMVEFDAVLGADGELVDLTFSVDLVDHIGDEIYGTWKDAEAEVIMRMPKFFTIQTKTQTTLMDGKVLLAASISPKDDRGKPDPKRKALIFIRADVIAIRE